MELYKFINENEIQKYKGGFVVLDNRIYTNPTEETIKAAGYKELLEVPFPEYDEASQYIETKYLENPTTILPMYTVKQIEYVKESEE